MESFDLRATVAQLWDASQPEALIGLDQSWWGWGGIHGGLALSLMTAAMQRRSEGRILQQVSGQFRRSLREPFKLNVSEQGAGKNVSWLGAHALDGENVAVSASAIFSVSNTQDVMKGVKSMSPEMPAVPPAFECPIFTVPPEFVPFARHTEIRPVGSARPYMGGAEPELVAWIRLVDDDLPPDDKRLIVLMDALAPSYSAVFNSPVAIPTVALTVTPGNGLSAASSPWVLLRARTDICRHDGWLLERLDAWAPDGAHLGSGEQLRVLKFN
ncbi:thioesterase family protein [Burkholderia stagnalis]|uniref:Thioesterase family protein n=1 Tax=Burkholderia stagnalis TaxID=1503054 RepID=A0ABX9YVY8_9BURK|nr:acyl-CoA thioesterase domain-containing protein [Burkholderia stagnalis]RQQ07727.1 thioesterase family protein [Burkholderia stagnalis]RQQ13258.1 thioesterase family protein [Burkholderia stagnalis]RQQ31689.1 thioesterase family protein [Burkholderia stagnalis]RQQ34414.1 thioesterase family protein [Burkholderia stagnalis]RQQ37529.1 thioesterase family protein [Burkholderia stagnalis]